MFREITFSLPGYTLMGLGLFNALLLLLVVFGLIPTLLGMFGSGALTAATVAIARMFSEPSAE